MVIVVVYPDFLPLAVVELPAATHLELAYRASVESKVEGESIVGGESDHE